MRVEEATSASPARCIGSLADLRSHAVWAGSGRRQDADASIDAPAGPALVGHGVRDDGGRSDGGFTDRSVVTEAGAGSVFEFVTEAT